MNDNEHWRARESLVLANAMQRRSDPAYGPVMVRGEGCRIWDSEGREFFDLTCGYSACNFGHAFEPLITAAKKQLESLTHVTGLSHRNRILLAERLIRHCGVPGTANRVVFNTGGARAVETAWKAAVSFRPGKVVTLGAAYHGRTIATSWLSDTARSNVGASMNSDVEHRPLEEYPYCAACSLSTRYPDCGTACKQPLLDWLSERASEISAVIVEPALGARGYIAPPAEYFRALRTCCDQHNVLLIADEIQMGLGRAGDWLMSRRQGWSADLVVLGKSLGGGLTPISAVVGRQEILDSLPNGCESETFAASPLATGIALEVLNQLEQGPWMTRADQIGTKLAEALRACFAKPAAGEAAAHPDIESFGGSASLEFLQSGRERSASATVARHWAERFMAAGLLTHYSGPYGTRIVLIPPLTITDAELNLIAELLRSCASSGLSGVHP